MKKLRAMIIMLICVGILFGAIFAYKWYVAKVTKKIEAKNKNPIVTVSSAKATTSIWQPQIKVVGSSRTVKGVKVTTQLAGMVTKINFQPGTDATEGQLLAQLNIAPDIAKLHQLEAEAKIAAITYHRDLKQYKVGGVSKETVDKDDAQFKSTAAQVVEQKAIIEEKTIRAPFSGRLGVRMINLGEYLNPGSEVVELQTLHPIYIDFYVPQEKVPLLKLGKNIDIKVDAYSKEKFTAPITTINPIVDKSIRNILVEATLANDQEQVLPGMYVFVTTNVGEPKTYITLPQMAVTFNPYGSIIYTLTPTNEKFKGKQVYQVHQKFVTTGDKRGDQVSVLRGIKVGDMVVTSGQLKIKNGSFVVLNNSLQPSDNPNPYLPTE